MTRFETVRTELAALLQSSLAMPFTRRLAAESLGVDCLHGTPVVLIHGLFGSATNFFALRQQLETRGVGRFTSFTYGPRIDYQVLAPELEAFIERLCERTGTAQVDVVGHSLGGLVARWLIEHGDGSRIRRLVTLGSPWYGGRFPARELALFGADDWLIPAPARERACGQVRVIPSNGHLSLLYAASALAAVADYLTASPGTTRIAQATERDAA
jgi:pimeloyl-ACP methyl ester carboxylesterase